MKRLIQGLCVGVVVAAVTITAVGCGSSPTTPNKMDDKKMDDKKMDDKKMDDKKMDDKKM